MTMTRQTGGVALLLCMALALGALLAPIPGRAVDARQTTAAQSFLDALVAGDDDAAMALFNGESKEQITAMGGMEAFLATVTVQTGAFVSHGEPRAVQEMQGSVVYVADLRCENGLYGAQIVVSENGEVMGFAVVPGAEDPLKMPSSFREQRVKVDAGTGYPLTGHVVRPRNTAKKVPGIVLVQGSGATDRDEVIGANRVFGKLAQGLAKQGIATLRYDKRNYTYPQVMARKDYSIELEYVEDVLTAVEVLKKQPGVDPERIFILGHSQGGMLAPLFIERGADVQGMILLAGTPRSLLDIMEDQQEDLKATYTAAGMTAEVAEYEKMQADWRKERDALSRMTSGEAMQAGTVYTMGAYYVYTLERYDAIGTIKKLGAPTLILQGSNDRQVYADVDYEIYRKELAGKSYATFHLYEGLNHIFTPSKAANIFEAVEEYNIKADIPAQVFKDIANWVAKQG